MSHVTQGKAQVAGSHAQGPSCSAAVRAASLEVSLWMKRAAHSVTPSTGGIGSYLSPRGTKGCCKPLQLDCVGSGNCHSWFGPGTISFRGVKGQFYSNKAPLTLVLLQVRHPTSPGFFLTCQKVTAFSKENQQLSQVATGIIKRN